MKKMMFIAAVALLGIMIIAQSCESKSAKTYNGIYNGSVRDSCSGCQNYSNVAMKGMIDPGLARQMSEAYAADSGKKYVWNGRTATSTLDARSIWFDLETIKRFIWEIENNTCRNGCRDTLGFRIYYGKYPANIRDHSSLDTVLATEANRHMVFIVPTHKINGKMYDFDPHSIARSGECYPPFDMTNKGTLKKAPPLIYSFMSDDPEGQNHGGLAPPPDDAGTFPYEP